MYLGVEGDDGLHDVGVRVPVEVLQVVGRQDVDVAVAGHLVRKFKPKSRSEFSIIR